MIKADKDLSFDGIAISPGIVIGKVRLIDRSKMQVSERRISKKDVEPEIKRFNDALSKSKQQLQRIKTKAFGDEKKDHHFIIDVHLMMLEDRLLVEDTIRNIQDEQVNAEWALTMVVDELKKIFENIDDYYLRQRSGDINYVGEMILRNLAGVGQEKISRIDEKVVLVAHDLSPADTAQMNKDHIIGFATDIGGQTSHTAIIARALEIPAVGGLEDITARVKSGDHVIVDGLSGRVIVNPGKKVFKDYLAKQQRYEYIEKEIHKYSKLSAETLDGKRIHIAGNIEIVEEIPSLINNGGEGIGLYRTEFIYMNRVTPPTEEDHLEIYKEVIEKVAPNPVTIRTLDVGMDKLVSFFDNPSELNPALGLRSIRFCLQEPEIFKTQLRGMLRASAHGKMKIMFPMISGLGELRAARAVLDEARCELKAEGLAYDEDLEVGIMIEVPSAVIVADLLAKEVDFFSIGTNDLIQYAMAIDRINEHVAYLYEPLHPAILRMVKTVVDAGHDAGISVGMCGEMAGDPLYSLLLIGMGLDSLSMNAFSIPRVKKVIRNIDHSDARLITEKTMGLSTAADIRKYLLNEVETRFTGEMWDEFKIMMN